MARPLRIAVPGGVYHVVARGNDGQAIYLDDTDRSAFLEIVDEALARFGWRCLTYCLMTNHYHLVIRTPMPNLSRGMRQLNSVYAQRFNRRHERRGHLFQGRFHSALIQEDAHLLTVARYVALNPVRAGIARRPGDWRWSGHHAITGEAGPGIITPAELLGHFGTTEARARQRYSSFVASGEGAAIEEDDPILGSAEFRARTLANSQPSDEVPRRHLQAPRPPLEDILAEQDPDQAAATAYRQHGYRMHEIAEALGCHYSTISRRIQAVERAESD